MEGTVGRWKEVFMSRALNGGLSCMMSVNENKPSTYIQEPDKLTKCNGNKQSLHLYTGTWDMESVVLFGLELETGKQKETAQKDTRPVT